jgi:lipoate-protein ligase A
MAADLYLLSRCADTSTIYIRFTQWTPPCITIGYGQHSEEVLQKEAMQKAGISWIRRPTGGRTVLHQDDLTYSSVFPVSVKAMGTTINQTYFIISHGLIAGLKKCGIEAQMHDSTLELQQTHTDKKLPCFLAPNRNEIMVSGKKLIGSAQKRSSSGVLQHGSIPISTSFRDLPYYCAIDEKKQSLQRELLEKKCACLTECLPYPCENDIIIHNLIDGFLRTLSFTYTIRTWKKEEMDAILLTSASETFTMQWMR